MLNGMQPTLTHLQIFGARCFARIPSELQEKLGPRLREAIFMGYPPGMKAWRCRDIATGIFCNSWDVIFDESFSNHPFPDSDDDDDDDSPAPSRPVAPAAPAPVQTAPAPPPARRSSRIPVLTAKGESYKKRLTADQARLAHQREIQTAKTKGVPPPDTPSDDLTVAWIVTVTPDPVASTPAPTAVVDEAIVPDKEEIGFPQVVANLIVTEASCLSVRSDIRRNPLSPDYNMQVPPATYDEVPGYHTIVVRTFRYATTAIRIFGYDKYSILKYGAILGKGAQHTS
jgi:hypothetical protein